MLRSTGKVVRLKLVRYVHGLKFEQLQQAIANSQNNSQATTPAGGSVGPPAAAARLPQQQQQQPKGRYTYDIHKIDSQFTLF